METEFGIDYNRNSFIPPTTGKFQFSPSSHPSLPPSIHPLSYRFVPFRVFLLVILLVPIFISGREYTPDRWPVHYLASLFSHTSRSSSSNNELGSELVVHS